MRIGSIRLTQFLSYEDEEIILVDDSDIPLDGIFFLSGPSESGKSSAIVDAVAFALFGPLATRVSARGLVKTDLRRRKASDRDIMQVEAEFVFDDGSVMGVMRSIDGRGKADASVWERAAGSDINVDAATSPAVADRYISERLGGMSRQQLPNSYVARQEEIDSLANLQGAQRRAAVHGMVGVVEVELARKETSTRLKETDLRIRQLTEALNGRTLEEEERSLNELQEENAVAGRRVDELIAEGKTVAADVARVTEQRVPLAKAAEEAERLNRLRATLEQGRSKLEGWQQMAADHEQAASEANREPQLRAASEAASALLQECLAEGQRARAIQQRQQELAEAREALPQQQTADAEGEDPESPEQIAEQLRELLGESQRLDSEREEREGHLKRLSDAGECYVCSRAFDSEHDHQAVLDLVRLRLEAIQARQGDIAALRTSLQERLPEAQRIAAEREQAARLRVQAQAVVDQLAQQLQQLLDENDGVAGDPAEIRARYVALKADADQKAADHAAARAAGARLKPEAVEKVAAGERWIRETEGEIRELQENIGDGSSIAELARVDRELAGLNEKLSQARGALPQLKRAAEEQSERLERAQRSYDSIASKLYERERYRGESLRLGRLATMLDGFIESLVAEIKPTIEQLASDMLVTVSDGKWTAMRLDDDYNMQLSDSDGEWFASSALSGGARVRAALCLRLALTRLVAQRTGVPIRFLVLDEPLPSQDAGHVAQIMSLLKTLQPAFPQIFVISHVGDLASNESVDYIMRFQSPPSSQRISLVHA